MKRAVPVFIVRESIQLLQTNSLKLRNCRLVGSGIYAKNQRKIVENFTFKIV